MRDEHRRLGQTRIDLVVRDFGLKQHLGALENLGQLGSLERTGKQLFSHVEVGLDAIQQPRVGGKEVKVRVSVGLHRVEGGTMEFLLLPQAGGFDEYTFCLALRELLGRLDGSRRLAQNLDVSAALANKTIELDGLCRGNRGQLASDRPLQ